MKFIAFSTMVPEKAGGATSVTGFGQAMHGIPGSRQSAGPDACNSWGGSGRDAFSTAFQTLPLARRSPKGSLSATATGECMTTTEAADNAGGTSEESIQKAGDGEAAGPPRGYGECGRYRPETAGLPCTRVPGRRAKAWNHVSPAT